MPVGVIFDSLSVVIGGLLGAAARNKLSESFKDKLNMIFGVCAMAMGISSIILMKNMPAVVLSVILGTILGHLLGFEKWVTRLGAALQRLLIRLGVGQKQGSSQSDYDQQFLTVIVLFCASGTGIYGAMVSGMDGDHSILIAKAILDLFTALIFACTLGLPVSLIAVPQFAVLFLLFLGGGLIFPLTTPDMVNDFKAVGGILLLATGFRMIKVKMFPTADMIPAMILAMPLSWLWQFAFSH